MIRMWSGYHSLEGWAQYAYIQCTMDCSDTKFAAQRAT